MNQCSNLPNGHKRSEKFRRNHQSLTFLHHVNKDNIDYTSTFVTFVYALSTSKSQYYITSAIHDCITKQTMHNNGYYSTNCTQHKLTKHRIILLVLIVSVPINLSSKESLLFVMIYTIFSLSTAASDFFFVAAITAELESHTLNRYVVSFTHLLTGIVILFGIESCVLDHHFSGCCGSKLSSVLLLSKLIFSSFTFTAPETQKSSIKQYSNVSASNLLLHAARRYQVGNCLVIINVEGTDIFKFYNRHQFFQGWSEKRTLS